MYEGPDPEALLAEVQADHGPSFRLRSAEQRRVGGVGGFFSRVLYRVEVEPDSTPDPAASAAAGDALARLVDETEDSFELATMSGESFDEILAGVAQMTEAPGEPDGPDAGRAAPAALPDGLGPTDAPARAPDPVADAPRRPAVAAVGTGEADPAAPAAADRLGRTSTVLGLLRFAGFPENLLERAQAELGGTLTLERVFGTVPAPRPLPDVPGSLIAVVGETQAALRTARAMARSLAVAAGSVAVAAPGRRDGHMAARTAEEAAALAPGWRRDRIGLVAVAAPPLAGLDWPRDVLRAMAPSYVLGMVSAATKTEDVERWAAGLGGVDALVLTDARRTVTPAAVLASGISVASLDGEPATPARWAEVVANLMTDL